MTVGSRHGSRRTRLSELRRWRDSALSTLALLGLAATASSVAAGAPPGGLGQRLADVPGAPPGALLERPVERLRVEVLDTFAHDDQAFTQGLLWHEEALFESTGTYGESTLRRVAPASGIVLGQRRLDDSLFGEGLARVDDRLIQLTWREGRALVWSVDGLEKIAEFAYEGEGWGLCHDGATLFMSDGSPRLTLRDPASFASHGQLTVSFEGRPVAGLNELECAEGWIYANLWQDDRILRIVPTSGEVVAVIDASSLRRRLGEAITPGNVLNGIAFRAETTTFFVTGKNWPTVFEVIFVE